MEGLKNVQQIIEYCKRGKTRAEKELNELPADIKKWSVSDRCNCVRAEQSLDLYKNLLDFIGI